MKTRKITAFTMIVVVLLLAGCTEKNYPEGAVAVVNGALIDEQQIEKEMLEREMSIAIGEKTRSLEPNSLTIKGAVFQSLDITEDELTPEQIRYIESRERSLARPLNKNEAFNILLRQEVLYQEAVKQGYEVSVDEAREILEESKRISDEALNGDKEALRKYKEIVKLSTLIYKQYGFESEEDYLNKRIDKIAKSIAISRMKNQFDKIMAEKLSESDGLQLTIDISNAWDDYGEFLIDQANIKILNSRYCIEFYGNQWNYGYLDLK